MMEPKPLQWEKQIGTATIIRKMYTKEEIESAVQWLIEQEDKWELGHINHMPREIRIAFTKKAFGLGDE